MTEEENRKAELMSRQMLNDVGTSVLGKLGIYKLLILALSEQDLNCLKDKMIFFNPLFSPASQTNVNFDLKKHSKIITVDINTLKLFTPDEGVAIILHEIGHALNPEKKGEEGEFAADDYAVSRNYRNSILSSLEKGKNIRPAEFVKKITDKRIRRLNAQQSA